MAMERLEALEARVRKLVEMVQLLKRENAELQAQLRSAREQLSRHQHHGQRWEEERDDIRARIQRVMGELDLLEGMGESKEVALE
jgi:FtsZ-binding cell division protein ZapB